MNVVETFLLKLNKNEGLKCLFETSPRGVSCEERGMEVVCTEGMFCRTGMDWHVS